MTKIQSAWRFGATIIACAFLAACGGGASDDNDAAPPPPPDAQPIPPDARVEYDAAPYQDCGDGLVTGTEECDDGNSSNEDACRSDCKLACGDGVVNESERCDTGISEGEGACPTACSDSDTCTADVLSGDNCQSECIFTPITAFINDDGCCPADGNNNVDNDCQVECGNGVLETGETCDTSIAAGQAGACPLDCADGQVCTTDDLVNAGTCTAACLNNEITQPVNGDGCCPPGADIGTDDDCSAACGDGVWSPDQDETCDTAIPAGLPGSCPSQVDCVDSNSCTADSLLSAGTCNAVCSNQPITAVGPPDGCCPPGGNATNDVDCSAECGNGVVEGGETCDDGNTSAGDGCDANCTIEPDAFRVSSLQLRDPHAFATVLFFCTDITGQLNTAFNNAITRDEDNPPDGLLDLSIVQVFRPLSQGSAQGPLDILFADCTSPLNTTACSPGNSAIPPVPTMAHNRSTGVCLTTEPGTVRPYNPAVTSATGPCYASDAETLELVVGGIALTLTNAQVGATYVGNPANQLVNGLVKGFISEAQANSIILPEDLPVVGGQPLGSILRGGDGNCRSGSDMDMGPTGEPGWWMYLNFTATPVSWTQP